MIEVDGVWKYFGDRAVLRDITFGLEEGELVGLVGPSGGGKSVLLKILGQVIQSERGEIHCRKNQEDVSIHVGFSFQEGALFDSMTVLENVAFPLRNQRDTAFLGASEDFAECCARDEALTRAYEILKEVGLEDAWHKMPGQISGGMRRRVGIARALVSRPQLVLLDDPTGGLDPVAASVIMELIRELHAHYAPTVILASHDIRRLLPAVSRVISLFDGKIIGDDRTDQLKERASARVMEFLKTRYDF